MMMGAAAGVVGGAAMGYMLGHTIGGFGHHGFGGGDQIILGLQVGALIATLIETLLYYWVGCFKICS